MKDTKFWAKVAKHRTKATCWEWHGAKDRYGYGRVARKQFGQKPMKAHRYAFYLHYGRWPEGECTHSCGNKACMKREHLYDDVRLANNAKPLAPKYMEAYAEEIQAKYIKGSRINGVSGLARSYGFSYGLVREIVSGRFGEDVRDFAATQ